ncbi:MAG: hypothetical protein JSS81_12860 [Acidobacteria bacterium]|nr:hypothetical protein [Acidobacteriota bacterium]
MSIFYKYKGTLDFAGEEEAREARASLLADDETVFFTTRPEKSRQLVCQGRRLAIDAQGFAGGELPTDSESRLSALARRATGGSIFVVYEGYDTEKYYIRASGRRRKSPATGKKK